MLSLIIDNRESKIKELLQNKHNDILAKYSIDFFNLDVGDVIIRDSDTDLFVFERKTIADLCSSIKDGRYKSQKIRLLEKYGYERVFYIIEGMNWSGQEDSMILGAIINTIIRDKVGIFFTKNVEETLKVIQEICDRIWSNPNKYKCNNSSETNTVVDSICTKTKSFSVYKNILCQIPGVSSKTADAIIQKYSCLHDLIKAHEEQISEIKVNGRKISGSVVKAIILHLLS